MSQYLSFKLMNKTNPEIKVDLGYWCTSIARGIARQFNGIFPYTEINVKLDVDTLKSYIDELHKEIDNYKDNLYEKQEEKEKYLELLLRADTQVVFDNIKENIDDIDESIDEWNDEIDTWSMVEDKLNFILSILEDNKDEWELAYKNS